MAELEIIGAPMSNYVRSVRMLCEEKGAGYKLNPARPHTAEVAAIHPAGLIPCMRHGDLALFESQAIATYIDKAFPGPRFIPQDPVEEALTVQWISYGNAKADRWILREYVVPSVFFDKAKGPDTAKMEAAIPEIEKCLTVLEAAVAKTGYLAGGSMTYADINLLPMLAIFQRFPKGGELLAKHPNLSAYISKLAARPSFINTAPPPQN
jgi:glutathione S-transferase